MIGQGFHMPDQLIHGIQQGRQAIFTDQFRVSLHMPAKNIDRGSVAHRFAHNHPFFGHRHEKGLNAFFQQCFGHKPSAQAIGIGLDHRACFAAGFIRLKRANSREWHLNQYLTWLYSYPRFDSLSIQVKRILGCIASQSALICARKDAKMIFDKFTLSLITAILGFGIWNIQRCTEDRKNTHAKVLKQDNLVRAIYAEIDFNTTDMEIFLTKSPSLPVLRKAMAERDDLIPHITDARHTWFYSSRISEMHVISDDLMSQIVQF